MAIARILVNTRTRDAEETSDNACPGTSCACSRSVVCSVHATGTAQVPTLEARQMRILPIPADARLLARNASRLSRSSDPVAIADTFGLAVYRATRAECGGSAALVVGNTLLVADDADVPTAVARAVGVHLARVWGVQTLDPCALGEEFARELAALGAAATAAA